MIEEYTVLFSNLWGCAIGVSDIGLPVTVLAESEREAIEKAICEARAINKKSGLPPHGIRVSERQLRQLAMVVPKPP